MRCLRYTLPVIAAVMVVGASTATAQEIPEQKQDQVKARLNQKADAAEGEMEQKKAQKKAMEKQQQKKAEQIQKEADKGSEKGQAMREEKSRKWWKFGGGKKTAAE